MSDEVILTTYRHTYGSNGKKLAQPCDGWLQIHVPSDGGSVFVVCSDCGRGWKFNLHRLDGARLNEKN
jgi:hypothetical protein